MLDVNQSNSSPDRAAQPVTEASLTQWIRQQIDIQPVQVRSRLRGNILHILVESPCCPAAETILPGLIQALTQTPLEPFLLPDSAPIYRVVVYGRPPGQKTPTWTQGFALPAESEAQAVTATPLPAPTLKSFAQAGNPRAIAHFLSEQLSDWGVAVRAKLERIPPLEPHAAAPDDAVAPPKRLSILCEAAYSPDPALLAAPIAQRLRELELQGFQDAIVFGQVRGESKPDWVVRIDLTPPADILREWARWGDVQAISQLLNRSLQPQAIAVSSLLKEATLHLTCSSRPDAAPDQAATVAAIVPLLTDLTPQGIQSAALYGTVGGGIVGGNIVGASAAPQTPIWVHWLELASLDSPLVPSTLELAQQGNLDAIAFLLSRRLNPDLDAKLATGGIRVQVRQKADLLHVMCDALVVPSQKAVGGAIVRCLQPLHIPEITGVRVYGRRAGQKQPQWSYGGDFAARQRLVPEVTPEFAASAAYVNDLLEPAGALALRPNQPETDWQSRWQQWWADTRQQVQRSLLRTQLFMPLESAQTLVAPPPSTIANHQSVKVALVWGTVGLLFVVQSDWLLGRWLQTSERLAQTTHQAASPAAFPTGASPQPSPIAPAVPIPAPTPTVLPQISLQKSQPQDNGAFNPSGFTQKKQPTAPTIDPATATGLLASPLQPPAVIATNGESYPTFNSRQLDDRLQAYRQYVIAHGAPDVLIVGSSRALRGVDPVALQNALAEQGYPRLRIFNFGINGATVQVVDLILRQLLPQEALPKLILLADGARALNSGRTDVTYNGIVASPGYRMLLAGKPPLPGTLTAQATSPSAPLTEIAGETAAPTPATTGYQVVNQAIEQALGSLSLTFVQRDRLKTQLRDQIARWLPTAQPNLGDHSTIALQDLSDATSPAASAANSHQAVLSEGHSPIDQNGFMPLPNRFNPATYYQKYARVPGDYDSDYEAFRLAGKQTEALANLAQFSQTHQIPLVFVNLPLTQDYLDPPRRQHEATFQQQMLQQASQLGFTYRDLSQDLADQPSYFSDPSHLNRYGGYEVSRRLAQDAMMPWSVVKSAGQ